MMSLSLPFHLPLRRCSSRGMASLANVRLGALGGRPCWLAASSSCLASMTPRLCSLR